MPLVDKFTTTIGLGRFGERSNSRPYKYIVFEQVVKDVISNNQIEIDFLSKNGIKLFSLASNVKDILLSNFRFTNDFRGCAECEINLNSPPLVDIQYGTKVKIRIGQTFIYTGYLFKPQAEFNSRKGLFAYKFFGLRQRYVKQKITLDKYNITSITKTGNLVTYNFAQTIPSEVFVNQRIGVRRCDSTANNGYFLITDLTTNSITVNSFFGVVQATAGGDAIILPPSCSNSDALSEIFKSIAKEAIKDFPELSYNPSKIEYSTGKVSAGFIDIDSVEYEKMFETLEILSGNKFYMGIDVDGDFFFKKIPESTMQVLNTGYDMVDSGLTLNYNNIANLVTGERTKQRGTNGNGFDVVGTAQPQSEALLSQAKFGVYAKRVQLPAYLSDNSIQAVIDNVLLINKNPRYSAKIEKLKFDRVYEIGNYDICPLPDYYNTILNECESLTGWASETNIVLSIDTSIVTTGNGSLEIALSPLSNGESVTYTTATFDLTGKKTLSFWMYSAFIGSYFSLILSDGINEFSFPVNVSTSNQFVFFEFDISEINLDFLTLLRLSFHDINFTGSIFIDKIDIRKFGAIHTNVPLKKASYKFDSHDAYIDLEFGDEGESLSEYLTGIQANIETQKLAAINRN
jgi:hypothetical protein